MLRSSGESQSASDRLRARNSHKVNITLPSQARQIAKGGYQCWGLEFRSQGGTAAPPGNLVDVYLRDLLCVMEALSLRGTYTSFASHPEFSMLCLWHCLESLNYFWNRKIKACCCTRKLSATKGSTARNRTSSLCFTDWQTVHAS